MTPDILFPSSSNFFVNDSKTLRVDPKIPVCLLDPSRLKPYSRGLGCDVNQAQAAWLHPIDSSCPILGLVNLNVSMVAGTADIAGYSRREYMRGSYWRALRRAYVKLMVLGTLRTQAKQSMR